MARAVLIKSSEKPNSNVIMQPDGCLRYGSKTQKLSDSKKNKVFFFFFFLGSGGKAEEFSDIRWSTPCVQKAGKKKKKKTSATFILASVLCPEDKAKTRRNEIKRNLCVLPRHNLSLAIEDTFLCSENRKERRKKQKHPMT